MLGFSVFVGMLAMAVGTAAEAPPSPAGAGHVVVCTIDEMIDDGAKVIAQRAVREAAGAAGLIFVIDTFGGRVDSAIEITDAIKSAPCPTVAFITGKGAISAGALISYACDEIIMAPGMNIGASTPFTPGAEQAAQVTEKSMSFLRAKYRALGEEKGHNPLLGEAMVDEDIELHGLLQPDGSFRIYKVEPSGNVSDTASSPPRSQDAIGRIFEALQQEMPIPLDGLERQVREALEKSAPAAPSEAPAASTAAPANPETLPEGTVLISPQGKLLTLTTGEALKYGLINTVASSVEEVMAHKGWGELRRVDIIPTWSEELYRWLTSPMISAILLMLGIGGIYIEVRTPGIGLPLIIGLTCLTIFFGAHYIIGLANVIDLVLVLAGIALIAVELFVIPGFGLAGIAGLLCLMAGVYLSLTHVTIPEYDWDYMRLVDAGKTIVTSFLLLTAFTVLTWKLFPRTPLFRWMANTGTMTVDMGFTVQTSEEAAAAVGLRGEAMTFLRPAGRGRFNGKTYDVMTRGEFLPAGTPIVIIEAEGNRYVVKAIKETNN